MLDSFIYFMAKKTAVLDIVWNDNYGQFWKQFVEKLNENLLWNCGESFGKLVRKKKTKKTNKWEIIYLNDD